MSFRSHLYKWMAPRLRFYPRVRNVLAEVDSWFGLAHHAAVQKMPQLIKAKPAKMLIAVTGYCNLRCIGCRYGRDFMPNAELSWPIVRQLLDDAREAGYETIRLYGGEPLLHRDLPRMVEHGLKLGMRVYVTTNGILLKEKIDELYAAGLRETTLGFYGVGEEYNNYVQRQGRFARLEDGITAVREKYGTQVHLTLNWLLMRPSCNLNRSTGDWHRATHADRSRVVRPLKQSARSACAQNNDSGDSPE